MRLTRRDVQLVRDLALSNVLCRDQVISLGYFSSVTRANTRLRLMRRHGFVRLMETPFYSQHLYVAGPEATMIVGERVAPIIAKRKGSPRFIQHALCTTNARIAMRERGALKWRFELQLRSSFRFAGRDYEIRPDGLAVFDDGPVVLEVDLGHVAPSKFGEKLRAYDAFAASGECLRQWKTPSFKVLTLTTGKLRAARLARRAPPDCQFQFSCTTFDEFGVPAVGAWS